jgi:hypothetical protein
MPKSHAAYAPEFRRQMVELVRSGRTLEGRVPSGGVGAVDKWPAAATAESLA